MYTFIAYFIIYFVSLSVRALREVYLQVFHSQSINEALPSIDHFLKIWNTQDYKWFDDLAQQWDVFKLG